MMRINKVYKTLNKPLTIMGAERKLFFLALIMGASVFNLFNSLLGAIIMFTCFQTFGIWATKEDPEILRILLNSGKFSSHYSPFKFKPIKLRVIRRNHHV